MGSSGEMENALRRSAPQLYFGKVRERASRAVQVQILPASLVVSYIP